MDSRVDVVVVSYNSATRCAPASEPLAGARRRGGDRRRQRLAGRLARRRSPTCRVDAIESGRNGGFGFGCNLGDGAPATRRTCCSSTRTRGIGAGGPGAARRRARRRAATSRSSARGCSRTDGRADPEPAPLSSARGSTWAQALFLHRVLRRAPWANEIVTRAGGLRAAGLPRVGLGRVHARAARRRSSALGGFDEGFFLYCEDMDLCARLRAAVATRPLRAGRDRAPRGRALGAAHEPVRRPRPQPAALRAQALRPRQRAALQRLGLAAGALDPRRRRAAAPRAPARPRRGAARDALRLSAGSSRRSGALD